MVEALEVLADPGEGDGVRRIRAVLGVEQPARVLVVEDLLLRRERNRPITEIRRLERALRPDAGEGAVLQRDDVALGEVGDLVRLVGMGEGEGVVPFAAGERGPGPGRRRASRRRPRRRGCRASRRRSRSSLPSPPSIASLPLPPLSASSPLSPLTMSLPRPPFMVSSPSWPERSSSPALPLMMSPPVVGSAWPSHGIGRVDQVGSGRALDHRRRRGEDDIVAVAALVGDEHRPVAEGEVGAFEEAGEGAGDRVAAVIVDDRELFARRGDEAGHAEEPAEEARPAEAGRAGDLDLVVAADAGIGAAELDLERTRRPRGRGCPS